VKSSFIRHPSSLAWPVILLALGLPTLLAWVYFVLLADGSTGSQQLALAAGKVLQFMLPAVWVLGVERTRPRWRRPSPAGLAPGLAFGAAVAAGILSAYFLWLSPGGYLGSASQAVARKIHGFGVQGLAAYVVLAAFYCGAHSLLEEYYWRWFVFGQLRRLIPWRAAALVSGIGFAGHHVLVLLVYFQWPAAVAGSLAVMAGGVVWAWIYQRSGSLWGPWLSHLLVDTAIFTVGYHMTMGQ
jgi:membrane protease YdiL (CAAX protease family)